MSSFSWRLAALLAQNLKYLNLFYKCVTKLITQKALHENINILSLLIIFFFFFPKKAISINFPT